MVAIRNKCALFSPLVTGQRAFLQIKIARFEDYVC
jgi:hypothetical protein